MFESRQLVSADEADNHRSHEPVGCGNWFMQPADTRAAARRAGRGGAPGFDDLRRRRSTQRVGPVPQVGGRGVDDAGCRARCRPSGPAPSALGRQSAANPGTRRAVPIHRSAKPFALGACTGVSTTSASSDRNTSSKARQNLASRSRSRKRTRRPRSPNVSRRLRACWTTQAPSGLAVTPPKCTCRVSSSIKTSTYSRRSQMVSTVKKSQATMPAACSRWWWPAVGPGPARSGGAWNGSRWPRPARRVEGARP
jgi:hypothetical protein